MASKEGSLNIKGLSQTLLTVAFEMAKTNGNDFTKPRTDYD